MVETKILVIEDEVIIGDHLCSLLRQLGYHASGPITNYTDALTLLQQEEFDLALIDIILSGKKDGIELAEEIRKNYSMPIIFLTSHADKSTVDRAKKIQPDGYLVKPFSKDELYTSLEIILHRSLLDKQKLKDQHHVDSDYIMIKDKSALNKVFYKDILYLENDHIYIKVHTFTEKYMVRSNMSDLLNSFPSYFVQIHRGFVVNRNYVSKISAISVFINSIEIPIGKKYKELVKETLFN